MTMVSFAYIWGDIFPIRTSLNGSPAGSGPWLIYGPIQTLLTCAGRALLLEVHLQAVLVRKTRVFSLALVHRSTLPEQVSLVQGLEKDRGGRSRAVTGQGGVWLGPWRG